MNSDAGFRLATAADRDAILDLRATVFSDLHPEKRDPRFWEWSFRRGYAGEALVFVIEAGDRLIGHLAFIPQRYETPAGAADGALAVDAMIHPDSHRQQLFTRLTRFAAERLRRHAALCLAVQIREASLAGMRAGGWDIIDRLPVLIKPLSLRNLARDAGATFLSQPPNRMGMRSSHVRPIPFERLRELEPATWTQCAQSRSLAFTDWRYEQHPSAAYVAEGWLEGDVLQAAVVYRKTLLKGISTLAIADAAALPDQAHSLSALVREVCSRHRHEVALAAALISPFHPARRALARSGFFAGPHRFNLMIQIFDERFRAAATTPWALTWADTDHL